MPYMTFAEWLWQAHGIDWAYYDNNYSGDEGLYEEYYEEMTGEPLSSPDDEYMSEGDEAEWNEYLRTHPQVSRKWHKD